MWTGRERDDWNDDHEPPPWDPRDWWSDIADCMAFFTRLPFAGAAADRHTGMAPALRAAPLAGLAVGIVAAVVLWIGATVGLSPFVAATLAVLTAVLTIGALHEDGLADTADGLAGGWNRERRLEIMRDSRIGTYGALTLIFATALRIGAIAGVLAANGRGVAMLVLISAEAVSRMGCVWLMHALPAARANGASASAGRPDARALWQGMAIAGIVAFVFMASGAGILATVFALACAALATLGMNALARSTIGGHTGDVAGATQQAALLAFLLAAQAALPG